MPLCWAHRLFTSGRKFHFCRIWIQLPKMCFLIFFNDLILGYISSHYVEVTYYMHHKDTTHTHTHIHTQPFYGSLDFVRDNPGEPVLEETLTHSHLSWSSIVLYLLHPSNTIHGILLVQSTHLTVFFHNLCPLHTPYISLVSLSTLYLNSVL